MGGVGNDSSCSGTGEPNSEDRSVIVYTAPAELDLHSEKRTIVIK